MKRSLVFSIILISGFCINGWGCGHGQANAITIVEMNLNAFGVESDNFPSIQVYIDFRNDSTECRKSYYNPALKPAVYKLSHTEVATIYKLLRDADLKQLKHKYSDSRTDLPTSTMSIYDGERKISIEDYGLNGDPPLQEIYKIVYKI